MSDPLYIYSKDWKRHLEDRISIIRHAYPVDPERAHGEQDVLVFEYLRRRAASDDQEAIQLLALVGDVSLTRWYA